jgi:hypothetical protein
MYANVVISHGVAAKGIISATYEAYVTLDSSHLSVVVVRDAPSADEQDYTSTTNSIAKFATSAE